MNISIQGDNDVIKQLLLPHLSQCQLAELAISNIISIIEIQQGFSQHCFEISTSTQHYIAKVFIKGKDSQNNELTAYQVLNRQTDFTAKLLWHSSHVILLEKLSGQLLINAPIDINRKLEKTLDAVIKLHQLDVRLFNRCQSVEFNVLFSDLFVGLIIPDDSFSLVANFIDKTLVELKQYTSSDIDNDNKKALDYVLCHGDLNFANIFYQYKRDDCKAERDEQVKLIDFECLALMPREYDLAMLLAVNELDSAHIVDLVHLYRVGYNVEMRNSQTSEQVLVLNEELIQLYYQLALLINGLWYFKKYQATNLDVFKVKAAKQFALSASGLTLA